MYQPQYTLHYNLDTGSTATLILVALALNKTVTLPKLLESSSSKPTFG